MTIEAEAAIGTLRPEAVVDVYDWMRNLAMRIAMRALLGLDPDEAGKGAAAAEHFERALGFYGIDYPLAAAARPRLALAQADRARGRSSTRSSSARSRGAAPHPTTSARTSSASCSALAARPARPSPTARSATR